MSEEVWTIIKYKPKDGCEEEFLKELSRLKKIMTEKFDLIIDLQSKFRNTLILKKIPTKFFYSSTMNFIFCTKKLIYCLLYI